MKLHVFCFDLPQSDACFIKAYAVETMETFLDGVPTVNSIRLARASNRLMFCRMVELLQLIWSAASEYPCLAYFEDMIDNHVRGYAERRQMRDDAHQ
jgi:hypothetical protein